MNDKTIKRASKKLSWLLRHGAGDVGLDMDAAGWAPVDEVLGHARCSRATLEEVVARNNKRRFEWLGGRIRAAQGHSVEGMPVERAALERSWDVYAGGDSVWHGTSVRAARGIAREGVIHSANRTHVHLAAAVDSRVGKRAGVQLLLEISARLLRDSGLEVFQSPNGVVLVREVPVACVVGVTPVSRKAERAAPELRAALAAPSV